MRVFSFFFFVISAIAIYGGVNYYIFIRGLQSIPDNSILRYSFIIIMLVFTLSYIAGRILEKFFICSASEALIWIGSIWLGMMFYLFLELLVLDLIRFGNAYLHFFPEAVNVNYGKTKQVTAFVLIIIAISINIAGYINSINPVLTKLNIIIEKKVNSLKSLNIVMASDIHLGTIISNSRLIRLVDSINKLNPDIVLFAGDIVDEDIAPVIVNNLGEILKNIKSKYGIYAVTGNHEFIGGVEAADRYLNEHNIKVIRDSKVKIDNLFYIVGREDISSKYFINKERKTLNEIMADIDKKFPVILLDHQPYVLKDAIENGVDIQLSGHTHNGQIWPLNYITDKIFEIGRGYKKIEKTNFYVSNGFGTWGPPIRVGSRPEIVNIHVVFNG
jgi:predicted MPP superfamily phosphohydrolase